MIINFSAFLGIYGYSYVCRNIMIMNINEYYFLGYENQNHACVRVRITPCVCTNYMWTGRGRVRTCVRAWATGV